MKKTFKIFVFASISATLLSSCGQSNYDGPKDTPTTGAINITVDDSYRPMAEAEIEMFEGLYVKSKLNATYASEVKAFEDLLADSARLIIVGRKMNEQEANFFKQKKVTMKETHIASDGLAFIVNNENPNSKLLYSQVKNIFTGNIKSWKQITASKKLDSLKVIFDDASSGNIRMMRETFNLGQELPSSCFAVNSNEEVVKFVESHPNAMGIISVNWISDDADSTALDFLKKIKVLKIGQEGVTDTTGAFYGPYQGYIANKSYPFIRETYLISRESRAGLGTGFASFVASDKGQRIILRSGMVPASAPVRLVNINTQ